MNSADLSAKPLWLLKQYINAYHLSAKNAIEKDDLVRVIINTRPIPNESETFYRDNRAQLLRSIRRHQQRVPQQQQTPPTRQSPSPQSYPQPNRPPQPPPPPAVPQTYPHPAPPHPRQPQPTPQTHPRPDPTPPRRPPTQQPPPSRSAPNNNSASSISLDDIVNNNIDPAPLSVQILKSILRTNFVEQSHVLEKSELVSRVQCLVDERRKELQSKNSDVEMREESMCRLCCDAQQNCVFLDCGHMVTCMGCGKKLVETNNQCPICREPILKLVHVFRS
ncbi:hypothetical protein DFQ28_008816 [Apophysomyces sp. BC1034]|nr:hypothetical protein DFQ30_002124 [Apophysomyces sp. BC1015]KAG0179431.1 hypothetical protein DFQ29_002117 [Apophysomyces sp. BC1021]KAG0185763.1 hypothetical protein DFQ28_008816 [Apophysomyces sp. BC1034]